MKETPEQRSRTMRAVQSRDTKPVHVPDFLSIRRKLSLAGNYG